MRITIELNALRKAVGLTSAISPANPSIPIISHVLISAEGTTATFVGTDLGHEISVEVPADVEQGGVVAVPAARLRQLAQGLPDGAQVTLWKSERGVEAKSGRTKVALLSLDPADFPRLPMPEGEVARFTMSAPTLCKMFSTVVYAVNKMADRQYLSGVCLHAHEDRLRAVGADGYRMALLDAPLPTGAADIGEPIIPTASVQQAIRILTGGEATVVIGEGRGFSIECGGARLISKLIEGTFPDYRGSVMRSIRQPATEVLTDIAELRRAVGLTLLAGGDKFDRFRIDVTKDGWAASLVNANIGEAMQEIVAEVEGEPGGFLISPRFLSDALAGCTFETGRAKIYPDTRLISFEPANSDGPYEVHLAYGMTC